MKKFILIVNRKTKTGAGIIVREHTELFISH